MNLYVCFDDSTNDPTYTHADSAFLVESESDGSEGNPCAEECVRRAVPILPNRLEEIEVFASIMGWSVGYDNDGQVILYTGIHK